MSLASDKIAMTKHILDTQDPGIINHIKAVFETSSENWWDELPSKVKISVEKGLEQSKKSDTVAHKKVAKRS